MERLFNDPILQEKLSFIFDWDQKKCISSYRFSGNKEERGKINDLAVKELDAVDEYQRDLLHLLNNKQINLPSNPTDEETKSKMKELIPLLCLHNNSQLLDALDKAGFSSDFTCLFVNSKRLIALVNQLAVKYDLSQEEGNEIFVVAAVVVFINLRLGLDIELGDTINNYNGSKDLPEIIHAYNKVHRRKKRAQIEGKKAPINNSFEQFMFEGNNGQILDESKRAFKRNNSGYSNVNNISIGIFNILINKTSEKDRVLTDLYPLMCLIHPYEDPIPERDLNYCLSEHNGYLDHPSYTTVREYKIGFVKTKLGLS